jgi:lantibiotic leader peptide-processing serine protease
MRRLVSILTLMAICLGAVPFSYVAPAQAEAAQNYVILYKGQAVPSNAASSITAAGGTLVYSYNQVGVVVASSNSSAFRPSLLLNDSSVQSAVSTGNFATQVKENGSADNTADPVTPLSPASGSDSLSGLQWDMDQINAPQAHAINGGSPGVTVGDIDTGLDYHHPDLAPNVDFGNSVSCIGGVPNNSPSAWMDNNGHGTHTAGTIAAASNGIGIVGVAPNVKIAGIKAGNDDGFFFPEAIICAFMWVGTHHIQVTNNSYFADPWLFNCKNDPGQRAIWEAERRAIRFAMQSGTVVVAAEGNEADDLAHPTQDVTSPDDSTPVTREITNACAVIPVEVSGVIGVTANGNNEIKSFYSSYGVGSAQLIAPGGDSILQRTAAAPNGRVLSTWPASLAATCSRKVVDSSGAVYCYLQGTSMASPHVAGVAALVVSMGITSPGAVSARLKNTADPLACPSDMSVYASFPSTSNGAPQTCQGGTGYNGFNGSGQVNALGAVTR